MTRAVPLSSRDLPFEVRPQLPGFAAEIIGIDLDQAASPEVFPFVHQTWLSWPVLVFRGLDVSPESHVAFASRFGDVQVHVMDQYHGYPGFPELYALTNLDENGQPTGTHPAKATLDWHTDSSWSAKTGHSTFMYAERPPNEGGETHFADMYLAWDSLSDVWKSRLESMEAVHNLDFARTRRHGEDPLNEEQKAKTPPVTWPIVRVHPETGRKTVFLGGAAEHIVGMDYDEGRDLIEQLNAMFTPDDRVYRHNYEPGDFVFWDNRCTMHRATMFDTANDIRVMRRCTVLVDEPY